MTKPVKISVAGVRGLSPGELHGILISFLPAQPIAGRHTYQVDVEQLQTTTGAPTLIGGQTFFIKLKNP